MDLTRLSALDIAATVAARKVSAVEVVEAHLARIEAVNPSGNAVVRVLPEEARQPAAALDARLAAGEPVGPHAGVPVTIKDNIDRAGLPTPWGVPAVAEAVVPIDAPVVERMRAADAIPVGRTNLPDMALRLHTDSSVYGLTRNPWNLGRTTGGSSGGDTAALASGMSAIGLGKSVGGPCAVRRVRAASRGGSMRAFACLVAVSALVPAGCGSDDGAVAASADAPAAAAPTALPSGPPGLTRTEIARGVVSGGEPVEFKPGTETVVVKITLEPGASTGWHSHQDGGMFIVNKGVLSNYGLNGPTCKATTISAGAAYFVPPHSHHGHLVRNEGKEPLELTVYWFNVPPGAPTVIKAERPSACPADLV
ncbi:MAG TPA: amidase family protein [Acidimicrobiales bacterium]|nr:amidase family protein [Acidimicrobiales bacterium]